MTVSQQIEKISKPSLMQQKAKEIHKAGKTIGFVPTMGFFHPGHLNLMKAAREETDIVVVSIFVNPIQFGPSEDFCQYPRNPERDLKLAAQVGTDIIFCPSIDKMYPPDFLTKVKVENLSEKLCGRSRPGHFEGVTTVVCKLFHIIMPDIAYFGQKDAQQSIIIKKMVNDLNFGIKIRVLPIMREKDGLAMSSRNAYLSDQKRQAALCLFKAIRKAEAMVNKGERGVKVLLTQAEAIIKAEPQAELEYIVICHPMDLTPLDEITDEALLAIAVKIGETRLIDNAVLKIK